jgi:hypothetical protein
MKMKGNEVVSIINNTFRKYMAYSFLILLHYIWVWLKMGGVSSEVHFNVFVWPDTKAPKKIGVFPKCPYLLLICCRTLPADDARRKNMLLLSRLHYEKASCLMLQLEHPLEFLRVQLERVALSEFQAQSMWITSPPTFIT